MLIANIAIIGGGVSGLYAAYMLECYGIRDYVLLEAREALGGRIMSVAATDKTTPEVGAAAIDRFDLGPTWFWPDYQPELHQLIHALGLERFEQFDAGDMTVERSLHGRPMRIRGDGSAMGSWRLAGGMETLIDALRHQVDQTRIITGQAVRALSRTSSSIELKCEDASGSVTTWHVEKVLLAIPPRLAEASIAFEPVLPLALASQWRSTATWMASHAKYVAVYDTPFWREYGQSGEARSTHGPLVEIHDASMPGGSTALFGFFGVPARVRKGVSTEVLLMHCRAQLARLFGPQAEQPCAEFIKDWAQDPYTATAADVDAPYHHVLTPAATAESGPWHGCLTGIASEWSPQYPGYVAGAIEASRLGVQTLLSSFPSRTADQNDRGSATVFHSQ